MVAVLEVNRQSCTMQQSFDYGNQAGALDTACKFCYSVTAKAYRIAEYQQFIIF